ncbi:MAG: hypothetical protein HOI23_04055 [Deltaproteobacteria bacterium]|nr:hypothetical protein [Deltaproteobacteria bacterium]MBT6432062.1 hypothetical protein [Deltaproteobacteria bacterium]
MSSLIRMLSFALILPIFIGCSPSLTPQEVFENHQDMFEAVENYINDPALFVDGDWQAHWGDGQLFGPSYDLANYRHTGSQASLDRALLALEANRARVAEAAPALLDYSDNLETISMSLLSLLEAGNYLEDTAAYLEASDQMIVSLESLTTLSNDYLDIAGGEFAADTYGPTAMTAFVTSVHLERVDGYPDDTREHHLERADAILNRLQDKVWDAEREIYLFAPGDERVMLYPNVTVMGALSRAYQLTGNPTYKERFEATYRGIQALKDEDGDHYHSPYSKESMGATDDDYTTHSSQNYLMIALIGMYQATGETKYLEEVNTLLGFLKDRLLVDGQILHHWIDGRAAGEPDPYIYCLGCNVQTLYLLLVLQLTLDA